MKISDEAVQAAQAECRRQAEKYNWYSWPSEESMRSIVTAALPHLPAGCKIKQLEWVEGGRGLAARRFFTTNGMYSIAECHDGSFIVETDNSSKSLGGSGNLKAAKQLAQADFERRIGECIDGGVEVAHCKANQEALKQALEALECLEDAGYLEDIYEPTAEKARKVISSIRTLFSEQEAKKHGWLYFNKDTGAEYSKHHPVTSGECPDALDVRPATAGNLLDELLSTWKMLDEYQQELMNLRDDFNDRTIDWDDALNSAALIVEGRSTAANGDIVKSLVGKDENEIAEIIAGHDAKLGAEIRALPAEPAQGDQLKLIGFMDRFSMTAIKHGADFSEITISKEKTETHGYPIYSAPTPEAGR